MTVRVINGDCRVVMATMDAASVDAIVTDPPYHLTTGKKGGTGEASVNLESPYGRARITTGFMGKAWDGGDVAHSPEVWKAALRVAKPGAYLLAFGGTRTFHRLAVAIEDAGWEIRDTVMWVYGSGFPKSHNGPWGGTALKPAWEPVIMARKPLAGTVAANVEKHGTGALNIDACRIETSDGYTENAVTQGINTARTSYEHRRERRTFEPGTGRWPANLIHDGSEEVTALFPEQTSGAMTKPYEYTNTGFSLGAPAGATRANHEANSGSAARFFYCAKADRQDRNDGLRGRAKKPLNWSSGTQSPGTFQAPGTDRSSENHHPTVKPTDLMRYLCRLVTPKGGTVLDPFMGSGSTLKAAELEGFSAIGIEIDPEYCEIARRRIASDAPLFADVA